MGTADLDRLEPRDREYVETLGPDERDVVVSTILRYQRPDRLDVGDLLPELELFRLDDGDKLRLEELAGSQPLVLVFGSFT